MFHGKNGDAMNDGVNIALKVIKIYKNAIRKACLTGKKNEGERHLSFLFKKHHYVKHYNGKAEYLLSQCSH